MVPKGREVRFLPARLHRGNPEKKCRKEKVNDTIRDGERLSGSHPHAGGGSGGGRRGGHSRHARDAPAGHRREGRRLRKSTEAAAGRRGHAEGGEAADREEAGHDREQHRTAPGSITSRHADHRPEQDQDPAVQLQHIDQMESVPGRFGRRDPRAVPEGDGQSRHQSDRGLAEEGQRGRVRMGAPGTGRQPDGEVNHED